MIDWGFLAGFVFGCICTAGMWQALRPRRPRRRTLPLDLGAAARGEVADLAVSAGQFISRVRSLRRQIDSAHETLRGIR
jgi:hypothetical protein